jgi:hypothetical protein
MTAQYVRIVGYGTDVNKWNSITEVEIYGRQHNSDPLPPPGDNLVRLPVQSVTASDWQEPHISDNTLDMDLNTRWSAEGDGQWIEYDLGIPHLISEVYIAWFLSDRQKATFDIEVSMDAASWTSVFSGRNSGSTSELQRYDFTPMTAQYVRIVGYGTDVNKWNSITEVEIYGTSK